MLQKPFSASFFHISAILFHFRPAKPIASARLPRYGKSGNGMFLQGFPVATVTFYVTKMTESFSAIKTSLLFSCKLCCCNSNKSALILEKN